MFCVWSAYIRRNEKEEEEVSMQRETGRRVFGSEERDNWMER